MTELDSPPIAPEALEPTYPLPKGDVRRRLEDFKTFGAFIAEMAEECVRGTHEPAMLIAFIQIAIEDLGESLYQEAPEGIGDLLETAMDAARSRCAPQSAHDRRRDHGGLSGLPDQG